MFQLMYLHGRKLLALAAALLLSLLLMAYLGEPKPRSAIDTVDIVGEGGTALICVIWIVMILRGRPGGHVTNLLTLGLALFALAMFQDVLDEFFTLADNAWVHDWLESGLAPLGVLILTAGIYEWHREQLAIAEQLAKRERLFRQHGTFDYVTQLSDAGYLRAVLKRELLRHRRSRRPLSLLIVDIENFHRFNTHFGYREGDQLLWVIAELLLFNLRRDDLLCRYAGDRFIILLPDTDGGEAGQLTRQLQTAASHLAYKPGGSHLPYYPRLRIGSVATQADADIDTLLDQLKAALQQQKSVSAGEAA